jgi:hypothetical protein
MGDIDTWNEDSAELLGPWMVIEIDAVQSQNIAYKARTRLVMKIKK